MINTDKIISRTNEEWKAFLRSTYHFAWGTYPIPEHWYTDRFFNWVLSRFNYGPDASGIDLNAARLVYKGHAYFWKNPIIGTWEVVIPPEYRMLDYMNLADKVPVGS